MKGIKDTITEAIVLPGQTYVGKLATKDKITDEQWDSLGVNGQSAYSMLRIHAIDKFKTNIEKYSEENNMSAAEILADIFSEVLKDSGYKEGLVVR